MAEVKKGYVRPLDFKHGRVDMSHGSGGRAMAQLIDELFLAAFDNEWLRQMNDQANFAAPAGRMVMAAQARGMDAMALSHALLRALWVEDRDIADPKVRIAIADEEGLPGDALHREEESQSILAEWERNDQEAVQRGVFGAPTFFCGDLWLWGQDRLFFLDQHLAGVQVQSGPSKVVGKTRAA